MACLFSKNLNASQLTIILDIHKILNLTFLIYLKVALINTFRVLDWSADTTSYIFFNNQEHQSLKGIESKSKIHKPKTKWSSKSIGKMKKIGG